MADLVDLCRWEGLEACYACVFARGSLAGLVVNPDYAAAWKLLVNADTAEKVGGVQERLIVLEGIFHVAWLAVLSSDGDWERKK